MKKIRILYTLFFCLSLHLLSGSSTSQLTIVGYRGTTVSVVVSAGDVETTTDWSDITSGTPIPVGELDLIVFNNTPSAVHNLEIYSDCYDPVDSSYTVLNDSAQLQIEILRNFDISGNITGFTALNPVVNPYPLLLSTSDIAQSYKLKINVIEAPSNVYINGTYRSIIIIKFVAP